MTTDESLHSLSQGQNDHDLDDKKLSMDTRQAGANYRWNIPEMW